MPGKLFGALALAIGMGIGSELRKPLGVAIVGGLIVSQILTLYTTPVIYLALDQLRQCKQKRSAGTIDLRPVGWPQTSPTSAYRIDTLLSRSMTCIERARNRAWSRPENGTAASQSWNVDIETFGCIAPTSSS